MNSTTESDVSNSNLASKISEKSMDYDFRSDYGNELFLYHVVPKIEKEFLNNYSDNSAGNRNHELDVHVTESGFKRIFFRFLYVFLVSPSVLVVSVLLCMYLLLFKKYKKINTNRLSVIRTSAVWSKIKDQEKFDDFIYIFDDLSFKNTHGISLYEQSLKSRLSCIFRLPTLFYMDCIAFYNDIAKLSPTNNYLKILVWFGLRMPHKIVYNLYLDSLLRSNNCLYFLSGNKDDRYAILENRVCERLGVSSICVPHGLEYGFKMPRGLFGDVFYCTSQKSKDLLSKLYSQCGQEFIFDRSVVKCMFGASDSLSIIGKPRVVFFPESREININRDIIKSLSNLNEKVFLKLHPSDHYSNYSELIEKDYVIHDLDEALNGTICLARRSTVLLESGYRKGYPCAVLFNQKDKVYVEQVFPSLSNSMITCVYNLNDLRLFISNVNSGDSHPSLEMG